MAITPILVLVSVILWDSMEDAIAHNITERVVIKSQVGIGVDEGGPRCIELLCIICIVISADKHISSVCANKRQPSF